MWECPKCKRKFKKVNQDHYCIDEMKTIDDYIALQPESVQSYLKQIRSAVHDAIPEALEKISWRMPTFYKKHNIIHFAAFKKHIGIYPGDEAIRYFAKELTDYKTSVGAIQIPYNNDLPIDLIVRIALWCYNERDRG